MGMSQDNSQTTNVQVVTAQVVTPVVAVNKAEMRCCGLCLDRPDGTQFFPNECLMATCCPCVVIVKNNTEMKPLCCGLCVDRPDGTQFFPNEYLLQTCCCPCVAVCMVATWSCMPADDLLPGPARQAM